MISVVRISAPGRRQLVALCLLIMMATTAFVRAESGVQQSIDVNLAHIRADNMKYDMKSGVSSYTGNVRFTYNGIVLSGDSVTIKQQNDEIEKLDIRGSPARYHQSVDNGETIMAESLNMTYSTISRQLVLTDNARLEQGGHLVESQRIIYDTEQEVVIAGQINPQDRVNITLTPKKETPEKPEPAPKPEAAGGR